MSDEAISAGDADAAALRILTPGLSAEETAAVTAVLLAAVAEQRTVVREAPDVPSAWVRTGQLRGGVRPGAGRWVRATR